MQSAPHFCDSWATEKAQHTIHTAGKFTYKQCTIGQILNSNPDYEPSASRRLPKRFFWENIAYAFGSPFIFLSGAAIFSAYNIKDVPLQKWAYITAALGGLWAAWGLYDSCFVDSNNKYSTAINVMNTRLIATDRFDPKLWLANSLSKTGWESAVTPLGYDSEDYKQVCMELGSNRRNIQRAIEALPIRTYRAEAQRFYAEVKKQEDRAFMLGGGTAAALALLLATHAGK